MAIGELDQEFEALLQYLKRTRSFDFTGYKRATLNRRIAKRMKAVGLDSFLAYIDYLEVHPEEFGTLFDTVLINVTGFFRDPEPWEVLRRNLLPQMLGRKPPGSSVRVWSAGSASGEEAYSAAMLFCELLGPHEFRERVKIYATDVDESALTKARQAIYRERDLEPVPPPYREKYFERITGDYIFNKEMRRQVIFGRHDLIQDAPISRVDLLICRNTLMYFNAEVQARVLARFHFALNDSGILFLGRAETLLTHSNLFAPLDLRRRLSIKVPQRGLRDRLLLVGQTEGGEEGDAPMHDRTTQGARDLAFDVSPVAQLVVDTEGSLVLANERARTLFALSPEDSGRPIQDLSVSYRPLEIRSRLEQVYVDIRPLVIPSVEWRMDGREMLWFDVQITPLSDSTGTVLGAAISFTDVSASKRLRQELEHSNQELEAAYEELQSTNEELETTNEELQSTVEELETTNEELQSSNEELETMNEELHSTNEELQTSNDELRIRSDEIAVANSLLGAILRGVREGMIVVNRELEVLLWNAAAEELWGLRRDEVVGRHLLSLDIGLPVDQLKHALRHALGDAAYSEESELSCVDRRGRQVTCRVVTVPLLTDAGTVDGAMLTIEQQEAPAKAPAS